MLHILFTFQENNGNRDINNLDHVLLKYDISKEKIVKKQKDFNTKLREKFCAAPAQDFFETIIDINIQCSSFNDEDVLMITSKRYMYFNSKNNHCKVSYINNEYWFHCG